MKRRLIGILLTLAIIFTLLPSRAFATETNAAERFTYVNPLYADVISEDDLLTYEKAKADGLARGFTSAARRFLSGETYDTVEKVAEYIRKGMVARDAVISVPCSHATFEEGGEFKGLVDAAMQHGRGGIDAPKSGDVLLYAYGGYNCSFSNGTLTYTMTYYTNSGQEAALDSKVDELKSSLGLVGGSKSAVDKVAAVNDWLKDNVSYSLNGSLSYSAYSAACERKAVCQGFATLTYRLLMESGIDTRIISGTRTSTGEAHAWNIVKIGAQYYLLDTTWNNTAHTNDYFLRGRDWFYSAAGDHTPGTSPESNPPHVYDYAHGDTFFTSISATDYADATEVETPSGVTASMSGNSVEINWEPVTGAEMYVVFRNSTIISSQSSVGYTDTSIEAGNTYYYQVQAYGGGVWSGYSDAASITISTPTEVETPGGVTASMSGNSVEINWEPVTGAEMYVVFRNSEVVSWQSNVGYTDTSIEAGNTYYYQVQAYGSGVWSGYSDAASITISTPTEVETPSGVTASTSGNSVEINWEPVAGAEIYVVFRNSEVVSWQSNVGYTDTSIEAGNTYYYQVQAYGGGVWSGYSDAASISIN